MKQIVWQLTDGRIAFSRPSAAPLQSETEQQYLDRVASLTQAALPVLAGATKLGYVEEETVPDFSFREAWKWENGAIGHDMAKCREIHRDRLRARRKPRLAALDVEYQRACEEDDEVVKAAVVERKQELRDAPAHPSIDDASTPEELMAAIPPCLQ